LMNLHVQPLGIEMPIGLGGVYGGVVCVRDPVKRQRKRLVV
jgi:hypothetical protein